MIRESDRVERYPGILWQENIKRLFAAAEANSNGLKASTTQALEEIIRSDEKHPDLANVDLSDPDTLNEVERLVLADQLWAQHILDNLWKWFHEEADIKSYHGLRASTLEKPQPVRHILREMRRQRQAALKR